MNNAVALDWKQKLLFDLIAICIKVLTKNEIDGYFLKALDLKGMLKWKTLIMK